MKKCSKKYKDHDEEMDDFSKKKTRKFALGGAAKMRNYGKSPKK